MAPLPVSFAPPPGSNCGVRAVRGLVPLTACTDDRHRPGHDDQSCAKHEQGALVPAETIQVDLSIIHTSPSYSSTVFQQFAQRRLTNWLLQLSRHHRYRCTKTKLALSLHALEMEQQQKLAQVLKQPARSFLRMFGVTLPKEFSDELSFPDHDKTRSK